MINRILDSGTDMLTQGHVTSPHGWLTQPAPDNAAPEPQGAKLNG